MLRNAIRRPAPATVSAFHVAGMHGLGDNLHQRAVVRQLMERAPVWLETSWPCIYHDLVGPRLHLVSKATQLPVYARNAARESERFSTTPWPASVWPMKIFYTPQDVRSARSVLGAMCLQAGVDIARADFRLPIPEAWHERVDALLDRWQPDRPLLIYRPLVERAWWGGCMRRNPDHAAYAQILSAVRDQFFVVSVADLRPGEEWMVGERIEADVELHAGELDFETLAALTARARLVYTSPGFAVILAQAVGTPSVVVFGGYENSSSFSAGARWAPYLGIDTLTPCHCFSHDHPCDKRIDVASAIERVKAFIQARFKVADRKSQTEAMSGQ